MSEYYSKQLKEINFDHDLLLNFYNTIDVAKWKQREDKLTNLWTMDENNSFDKNHDFYQCLVKNINVPIDENRIYFSRVHPGGMPNHWDYENFTKLQFPVICDNKENNWTSTPLMFIDKFDQVVEKVDHGSGYPIIYSSTYMHGTYKNIENKNERITLVVDLKFWFGRVRSDYNQNKLFLDNKAFWYV
jgi:hypothetical protein